MLKLPMDFHSPMPYRHGCLPLLHVIAKEQVTKVQTIPDSINYQQPPTIFSLK